MLTNEFSLTVSLLISYEDLMFGEDEEDQIPGNDDKKVTQRVHCLLINSIA